MACASPLRFGSAGVEVPLLIKQGGTFRRYFRLQTKDGNTRTPIDITNDTFHAQLRKKPGDATETATFTVEVADGEEGSFYIELLDSDTESIECGDSIDNAKSRYYWDCEWHRQNGDIVPLMFGDVKIHREITVV